MQCCFAGSLHSYQQAFAWQRALVRSLVTNADKPQLLSKQSHILGDMLSSHSPRHAPHLHANSRLVLAVGAYQTSMTSSQDGLPVVAWLQQSLEVHNYVSTCIYTAYIRVCLSVCVPACLPACLSVCLAVCLSVCMSVCLSVCLCTSLSVSLSQSVPLFVCASVLCLVLATTCIIPCKADVVLYCGRCWLWQSRPSWHSLEMLRKLSTS